MATVRDLLAAKQTQLMSVGPEATVLDAAMLMNEHKIGSLLVMDGGRLRGIVTERDILQRVVAQRRDQSATRVHEVMTADVICCRRTGSAKIMSIACTNSPSPAIGPTSRKRK